MSEAANVERYDELRSMLDRLPSGVGELIPEHHAPLAESQAAGEWHEFLGTDFVKLTYSQIALNLTFAADHMFALERALRSPVMTFAPWTLTRAVMEPVATGLWLLDPEINAGLRVARGMTLRYVGLRDQLTFVRDAIREHGDEAMKAGMSEDGAAERMKRVEAQSRALGFKVVRAKDGRILGFEESAPELTALVDTILGERSMWRLFSGVSHSRLWATLPAGLRRLGENSVTQDLRFESALYMITCCTDWFARFSWRYFGQMGWNLERLQSVFDAEYDRAGVSEVERFWRSDDAPPTP